MFAMADPIAIIAGPNGRVVELRSSTWAHVLASHPEMTAHFDDLVSTVAAPELVEDDPRPGRTRYLRRCGPERWLRVVVQSTGERDAVVTAFPQRNDPDGWTR